jgi:alanine-glyoxylate transaminase/(R)-3-amino-2-methylpropionate-pyruvate transaminase
VADLIAGATSGQVAGFIAETIQGVGGAVQLADGYLPAVYKVSEMLNIRMTSH